MAPQDRGNVPPWPNPWRIDRARQEKSWRRLQEIYDENGVIDAEVINYNKGGLLVNLDGVRGFVPASQVTEIRGSDELGKQAEMAKLIGTSLPLKVIEINRHRNRLILSERPGLPTILGGVVVLAGLFMLLRGYRIKPEPVA